MEEFSLALVGFGRRAQLTYIPLLQKMRLLVRLIAVCGHQKEETVRWGEGEQVPYYTSLGQLLDKQRPDLGIVCVSRVNHAQPVIQLIEAGIPVLVETPLGETVEEMNEMMAVSRKKPLVPVEVAENYIRQPRIQIIRKMIAADLFGSVNLVYSNFTGHGYHGAALIRSLLGFEQKPIRVSGFTKNFPVINHIWRPGQPPREGENWQHAIIEFETGATGVYSFSNLTYGSPLRQEFEKNRLIFYAAKGMGVGHDLLILDGIDQRNPIPIERRTMTRHNLEILDAYVAKGKPEIAWVNPLSGYDLDENQLDVGLCLYDLLLAIREGRQPEYGIQNGKIDRMLELTMERSWLNQNLPQNVQLSE
jgi:predicted dehydrogenase